MWKLKEEFDGKSERLELWMSSIWFCYLTDGHSFSFRTLTDLHFYTNTVMA